ncbi:hypothetical protein G6F24_009417 [Rhizopus arrhizus]|nr:hypothetical protein G6F24_009417 [Rhizopus arrhizus]
MALVGHVPIPATAARNRGLLGGIRKHRLQVLFLADAALVLVVGGAGGHRRFPLRGQLRPALSYWVYSRAQLGRQAFTMDRAFFPRISIGKQLATRLNVFAAIADKSPEIGVAITRTDTAVHRAYFQRLTLGIKHRFSGHVGFRYPCLMDSPVAALPGEILNSLAVVELVDPPTQAQPGTVYSVFLGVLVLLLHGLFSSDSGGLAPGHALGAKCIHQADVLALGQQALVSQRSHVAHGFRFMVISVALAFGCSDAINALQGARFGGGRHGRFPWLVDQRPVLGDSPGVAVAMVHMIGRAAIGAHISGIPAPDSRCESLDSSWLEFLDDWAVSHCRAEKCFWYHNGIAQLRSHDSTTDGNQRTIATLVASIFLTRNPRLPTVLVYLDQIHAVLKDKRAALIPIGGRRVTTWNMDRIQTETATAQSKAAPANSLVFASTVAVMARLSYVDQDLARTTDNWSPCHCSSAFWMTSNRVSSSMSLPKTSQLQSWHFKPQRPLSTGHGIPGILFSASWRGFRAESVEGVEADFIGGRVALTNPIGVIDLHLVVRLERALYLTGTVVFLATDHVTRLQVPRFFRGNAVHRRFPNYQSW